MKKFLFIVFLLFFTIIFFISCKNENKIENNISEITKIYFQGENSDGDLSCSISVGEREEPYKIDGVHNPNCDFSLVVLKTEKYVSDSIDVELKVNGEIRNVTLYFHPVNNVYINDLGYALNEDDVIELNYDGESLIIDNISKDFKVNYKRALEISFDYLSQKIDELYSDDGFMGECYLKILSNTKDNRLFWHFSIQSQGGESINIVISIEDGQVITGN